MRRFLLHVLPGEFHRIRYYGLIADGERTLNLNRLRELLHVAAAVVTEDEPDHTIGHAQPTFVCRHCGAAMTVADILACVKPIRAPPRACIPA